MPLYKVVHDGWWNFLVADSFGKAVEAWQRLIAIGNEGEIFEPESVECLCDDSDFMGDFRNKKKKQPIPLWEPLNPDVDEVTMAEENAHGL